LIRPAPPPSDDAVLVKAALKDRQAYADIVRRYEKLLGRYVRRLLGTEGQYADDILQELFIKAYVNLNDYDSSRPFAPWIYRIAHNEAMDFLRRRRTRPQIVVGEDASTLLEFVADGDDPESSLQRTQTGNDVRSALAELPGRYRDVLILRYLEDMSYSEIADVLEMPPGTVATLIRRGLKQLRALLRKTWNLS
jgi:RNA polymerase sigma-70 factor (ECF subfamily)